MKKIGKKTSLLVVLGLMESAGASTRVSNAIAIAQKPGVQTAAADGMKLLQVLQGGGDSSSGGSSGGGGGDQSSSSAPSMPAAPVGDFFAGGLVPLKQDANTMIMQDFKKQTEEMRQKAFTDGYNKGFSKRFSDGAKGAKSVPAAHPVAPANPADQAILAKMGIPVTDDLKREAEEMRQKAFVGGYSKGFAEGQKAAASQKVSKNIKKAVTKGAKSKKGATLVKKSVIKLATAPTA